MCAKWNMELKGVDELIKNIEKIPGISESIINKRLRSTSAPLAQIVIQEEIPISSWKGRILNKKHARDNKALKVKHSNLAFKIGPSTKFNYLKYPDLGIGTSKGNNPKEFIEKGLNKVKPDIISDLNSAVVREINKTLGE
jgi:hypothetical protein